MKKKPNTRIAMQNVIDQINQVMPFGLSEAEICAGKCIGCPKKLTEFMSMEVDYWQSQLNNDEPILLGDVSRLARIGQKVYKGLKRNGLIVDE
jgi:hypothetical protein